MLTACRSTASHAWKAMILQSALAFAAVGALVAQRPDTVTGLQATCSGCTVTQTLVTRLGKASDPELLSERSSLHIRDGAGRYYATGAARSLVLVYDSTGKYLTSIGRAGQGPLEPGNVTQVIAGLGDSVLVLGESRRVVVYSSDLRPVRSMTMPGSGRLVQHLQDGSVLFAASINTPRSFALPVHRVSPSGTIMKSFGAAGPLPDRNCAECYLKRVLPGPRPGSAWVLYRDRYQMELWDEDTGLQSTVVRPAPWYRPQTTDIAFARTQPRQYLIDRRRNQLQNQGASLFNAVTDGAGQVWWIFSSQEHPLGRGMVFEILDAAGRMVHVERVRLAATWVLSGELGYARVSDSAGYAYIDVYRMGLKSSN